MTDLNLRPVTGRVCSLLSRFDRFDPFGALGPLGVPRQLGRAASLVVVGAALSACGGGDDYTPSVAVATTVADEFAMVVNAESQAIMRKGDTWMYEWVNKTAGTGYYTTHYLTSLDKASQLYTHSVFYSDTQPYQTQHYSSANALTLAGYGNTLCRYEPQTRSPFPRRPFLSGASWSYIWSESCLTGSVATQVDKTIVGRVVSVSEPLSLGLLGQGGTVTGGSAARVFDTVKYTATRTDTTLQGTWTYLDTCWHDKAQDRTVKCDTQASYVPAGSSAPTVVNALEQRLAFVREVRTASPVLITDGSSTVATYAGRWNFKLVAGGGLVTCPSMTVSLTGQVSGNCIRVLTPATGASVEQRFTASGFIQRTVVTVQNVGAAATTRTVDAITVVADTNPNLLSVTGEMTSLLMAEGTWISDANIGTGTWVAQRL